MSGHKKIQSTFEIKLSRVCGHKFLTVFITIQPKDQCVVTHCGLPGHLFICILINYNINFKIYYLDYYRL